MKRYLLLLAVVFVAGCKPDSTGLTPVDQMASLREKAQSVAARQVSIEAKEVPQLNVKSASLTLKENQNITYLPYVFSYNVRGALVGIATGTDSFWSLASAGNLASLIYSGSVQEYTLNGSGLGEKAQVTHEGNKSEVFNYFKNGYWVSSYSTDGKVTSRIYSKEGDLLQWEIVDKDGRIEYNATYEYTDRPNVIRQEVNRWETPHFAFRGDVLGRYSTHLLKKATINSNNVLNFEYSFDDKDRVSSIAITRTQGSFEPPVAQYGYTYE